MEPHLTEEEIIRLINRSGGNDDERLYRHLLRCDKCLADYKYMVQTKIASYEGRLPEEVRRSLIEVGDAVAQRAKKTHAESPARHRPVPPVRRRAAALGVPAALLVVVVAAVWFWWTTVGPPAVGGSVTEPIHAAMTAFSNRALVVLPGTEDGISASNGKYRSGPATVVDDSVLAALENLSNRYGNGDESRDVIYWLIGGYFATRQPEPARDVARRAVQLYPDDAELATMAALAAYYSGDLDTAEQQLRQVLRRHPDYAVAAVNIGVVLFERGEFDAAEAALLPVIDALPGTGIANRTQRLLEIRR
jgi:tetratricopeptide (TPR) repeat protein